MVFSCESRLFLASVAYVCVVVYCLKICFMYVWYIMLYIYTSVQDEHWAGLLINVLVFVLLAYAMHVAGYLNILLIRE